MSAAGWGEGYEVGSTYAAGFFSGQSPSRLGACAVLAGVEPPDPSKPFTCCELGSGQGLTAAVLAATHPQGQFHAVDFMPSHIAAARSLGAAAGLDNLIQHENSFAELADGKVDLPAFDCVTLHGVYSWVSPENRAHIVRFLGRCLKPGGLVYVSYNTLPGWAAPAPLQRLVLEHAASQGAGSSPLSATREFLQQMEAAGARYFTANATPELRERLADWRDKPDSYLSHEYLNQCWQPLYHADVAQDLAAAKLTYAGPSEPGMRVTPGMLPPAQRALLEETADPVQRETLIDMFFNTRFRSDVFVRGARPLSPSRRAAWVAELNVALTVPVAEAAARWPTRDPGVQSVVTALSAGPCRLDALAGMTGLGLGGLELVVSMLTTKKLAALSLDSGTGDDPSASAACARLNRVLARAAVDDDRYPALAAPRARSGLRATRLQRLVFLALHDGAKGGAAVTAAVRANLAGEAMPLDLPAQVESVLTDHVPLWHRLGLFPAD